MSRSDTKILKCGDFHGDNDDDRQTKDKTECFTPCACARGNYSSQVLKLIIKCVPTPTDTAG